MKAISLLLCLVFLIACQESHDEILGKWQCKTSQFKAIYDIQQHDQGFYAQVIQYDDGTYKYSKKEENPKFLFWNFKYEDGQYVDGQTGATKETKTPKSNITLKMLHQDSLEVTYRYSNGDMKEIWTRIKNQ